MKKYTVVWTSDALDRLAEIWMSLDDHEPLNLATEIALWVLATDPEHQGRELREGLRMVTIPSISIFFTISEQDRIVEVSHVRLAA